MLPITEVKADREEEKKKNNQGPNDDIQKLPGAKPFYEPCYSIFFPPVTTSHMNPRKATVQPTRDLQLQLHFLLINQQQQTSEADGPQCGHVKSCSLPPLQPAPPRAQLPHTMVHCVK